MALIKKPSRVTVKKPTGGVIHTPSNMAKSSGGLVKGK